MTAPTYAMRLPSFMSIVTLLRGRVRAHLSDERAKATMRMAARSHADRRDVVALLARYGIEAKESSPIVSVFARHPAGWNELASEFADRKKAASGIPLQGVSKAPLKHPHSPHAGRAFHPTDCTPGRS